MCTRCKKIFSSLKSKHSCGIDDLSTHFLKYHSDLFIKPITLIINQTLNTGIFPEKLKIAKVIPIHKDKNLDTNILNNYRPISILPSFSKIFERVIYNQLYKYFTNNNFLYASQYGFRNNHSTEFAALELSNRIHEYLDNNLTPIAVFIDLSKAFDTINHEILIKKLQKYGITNIELKLFESYLKNRKQFVFHNNISSSHLTISTGVPQGSILGPLLFIIYINEIHSVTSFNTLMYADDTCLISPFSTQRNKKIKTHNIATINIELNKLFVWLSANKLSINVTKTKAIMFHYKQRKILQHEIPVIKINNISIKFVQEYKFLGVFVDQNLSWEYHIHHLCNQLSKINGLLSKLKHFFPRRVLY